VVASSFGQVVIHNRAGAADNRDVLAGIVNASPTVAGMCAAGLALLAIGALAARHDIAASRGLDKIVALRHVCVAVPLAIFGALHLFGARLVTSLVPPYIPWRVFWVYAVGAALVAASVSIAARIAVRWSGLLFGVMMFLFVAMIHLPVGSWPGWRWTPGAGKAGAPWSRWARCSSSPRWSSLVSSTSRIPRSSQAFRW
jgi:uncharacterized membrane protein